MTISALDRDTVKLLTTTQVITSISSAAKELIENALDANAKNIEINLTENGCALIEVKDNGCGISKDDAACMALSSHTSKIFNFSDLESLQTYGFRGEALHALSSVSDLTVISKTEQDEAALLYNIDHSGCIIKTEHCHRATGTTVQVRQLFKQMPVRRQAITNPKTVSQDIKTLESLIKSYGICKFFIQISYKVDNNIIFAKPSTATLEEAVTYVLGKRLTSNMNWLDITDAEMRMKLMVPSKKAQNILEVFQSRAQYIFVNNRPVKHKELEKVLSKIILEGLGLETLSRKKPIFVLYILTNAANIDVNLEPNKTSILFKEKNTVIDTIQRHVENFYDIRREEAQQDGSCDHSFADYQDYTQKIVNNVEDEQPACKKRKLPAKEDIVTIGTKPNGNEIVTDSSNSAECNIKRVEEPQTCTSDQHYQDECSNNSERDFQVPPLNLSETDSNDSQKCKLVFGDKVELHSTLKETTEENTKDSPPFELSPLSEKLSQLPIVDLGDDIPWDTFVNINTDEKENAHCGYNSDTKRSITVIEWSKGHASGLKGGTDVQARNYRASNELSINDVHGPVCEGFLQFSKRFRSKGTKIECTINFFFRSKKNVQEINDLLAVTEQNPAMTAPQIAHTITNLWKKLSPEERGYYRDLARDEKSERDQAKQDAKRKHQLDINKNKNRLLNAFQKMKTMNLEKQQNLVMRTTVSWDIDLKKVTDCFLNNTPCKNTNSVIGPLCSNLWIVHKSAHIWIVDARNLQKELNASDAHTNMENAENVELLLQRWFSTRNDMSLLHPIHSLTDK